MFGPCSVVVLLLSCSLITCQRYIVPEASLQFLSPRGLKISIPDIDKGVTLVAFHININEEFYALEHGQWAQDIIKKREGRWTYIIQDFKVKQGDIIYYWVYVIVDGLGYQGLDRSYKVTQANPHGPGSVTIVTPRPEVTPENTPEPVCKQSATTHDGGLGVCKDQVLLDKHFNNLDGWNHQVHIGGSQPDDEFTVFMKDSSLSFVKDGKLTIKPDLLENKYNENFISSGTLSLEGCTSNKPEHCSRKAEYFLILPPVASARLTSEKILRFRYGTVEVKAKLPHGDWIVPELWLEPASQMNGQASERVVLGLVRGNSDNSQDRQLEAGILSGTSSHLGKMIKENLWTQDYHIFKLIWTPEYMQFLVNGQEVTNVASGVGNLNNEEFYLTFGVHAAGTRDFPDTANKPWKNSDPKRFIKFWEARNAWHSTWGQDSALQIEYVKVTAL